MLLLALREAETQIEAAVEAEDYELAGSLNDEVDQLNGTIAEVSQLQQPAVVILLLLLLLLPVVLLLVMMMLVVIASFG